MHHYAHRKRLFITETTRARACKSYTASPWSCKASSSWINVRDHPCLDIREGN